MDNTLYNILVVDDNLVDQKFLSHFLEKDPEFRVVATLKNAQETLTFLQTLTPDLILIDINIPDLDGYHISQLILNIINIPIILMSSTWKETKNQESENAIYSGALASIQKPSQDPREMSQFLKLVKELLKSKSRECQNIEILKNHPTSTSFIYDEEEHIIAIGASLGGPQVIKELLSYLKPNLKPSILIAIHSSDVPNEWMLTDLQEASALPIKTAQNSEFMEPGRIYLCPNGHHLTLSRSRHLYLKPRGSSDRFCPSIDIFFASIAKYHGDKALGVILSGLANDAAEGAHALEKAGGQIVIQDQITSSSFAMPFAALHATEHPLILPVKKIAALINGVEGVRVKKKVI